MLTPFQFGSNNPIQNIDLDGLEGVPYQYTDPKQMLFEAGGDISKSIGSGIDMITSKIEFGYTWIKNIFSDETHTVSLENTNKFSAGVSFNTVDFMTYVKRNNISTGAPSLLDVKLERTQSLALVTQQQLGPLSIENVFTLNSDGTTKKDRSITYSNKSYGIPTEFEIGDSKTKNETTHFVDFTVKPTNNIKLPFTLRHTQSTTGSTTVEFEAGGELKIGNKSGIKLFSNISGSISF